ncbi:GNAT family N-acetyltransferase, partial [Streptococcus pneumoniae]|uniref:GNAT family N-acetyltransferase n=1 Tax=Streptococcus pneumoniae TaxID=1313 RepID=UPI001E504BA8
FGYPFNQLGCVRMTSLIRRSNARSRRFCEGLGFQVEGVIRLGFRTEDAILLGLLRSECRFLR